MVLAIVLVLGASLLSSCTTWKPLVLPDGQQGFAVDCSGSNLTWTHCYQKAARACDHGYTVVQRIDNHGGHAAPGNLFGLVGGAVVDRSMLIQCRTDGVVPVAPDAVPAAPRGNTTPAKTFPTKGDDPPESR